MGISVDLGFGLLPSAFFATACTVAISMLLERLVIRPIRVPTEMTYMMITIASASVLKGLSPPCSGALNRGELTLFSDQK